MVDDFIIYDKDINNHASKVRKILKRYQERRISINRQMSILSN